MLDKKASPKLKLVPPPQQQLEFLYARRMAIDTLIESLEQYDRFRCKTESIRKRKTA
jgi:hypothetical protein